MEKNEKKKIKDMTAKEFKKYKKEKQKDRRKTLSSQQKAQIKEDQEESRKDKISKMSEEEKIWDKWCKKEDKRKSRSVRTKEGLEKERLADCQRKRNKKMSKVEEDTDDEDENIHSDEKDSESDPNTDSEDASCDSTDESDSRTEEENSVRNRKKKSRQQRTNEHKCFDTIHGKHEKRMLRRRKSNLPKSKKQYLEEIEDWLEFFWKNQETKEILKKKNHEMYLRCEDLVEERAKNKLDMNKRSDSLEECTCDYDIDCAYCSEVYENERGLMEKVEFNADDDEVELKEYRDMNNKIRREKYQEKIMKANVPIPALPERELCEYEKIREKNMAQLERELAEYEARLEAESKQK